MTVAKGEEPIGMLRELENIKKLLVLALLRNGVAQTDVAKALGVAQGTISKMFPGGAGRAPTKRR